MIFPLISLHPICNSYTFRLKSAAYGKMFYADKTFERISTKFEKPLQLVDRTFHNLTTSDDPILQKVKTNKKIISFCIIAA